MAYGIAAASHAAPQQLVRRHTAAASIVTPPRPCAVSAMSPSSRSAAASPSTAIATPSHPQQQQQQQQQRRGTRARRQLVRRQAGAMDVMPAWTLDQIAGLVFGGVMVAFLAGANQVDVWVAKQQRRQLGLCERCGGLNEPGSCAEAACPMRAQAGSGSGGSSGNASS